MTNPDNLSPTKKALLALQKMQQKLDGMEKEKSEAIALIGMGCRFPGANNPDEFWELLLQGKNAVTEVPASHWDVREYCNNGVNTSGLICNSYGGFVPNLKEFDAGFFRIAPREAASLDPQQRLLLEVSWEALENAAIPPEELKGSATGFFIAICGTDYWHKLLSRNPTEIDAYLTTGNTHSLASGRLSHFYGTTAPSISLDTACSSSLVAVHLAIKSLRDRESNIAVVGGVNRLIVPEVSINFTKAKMLSPDGLCKTFDEGANGFVRSEGCGIVVLKRLSDAIADKDNIRAVLLGSAVNQDGRTSSITTPNSLSQQEVIKQALKSSKVKPEQVSFIETHGTGTSLGDAIEIKALSSVFANNEELILGAVKTNIGHLEAASGIASLIKTVLALQNKTIPPNLHLIEPNTAVEWKKLPFNLPSKAIALNSENIIAGVSAFGFSGTNAHIVIKQGSRGAGEQGSRGAGERNVYLFTLSARTQKALYQLAESYISYLQQHPVSIEDVCYTVNTGRSHFNYRLACTVSSISQLQTKLNQYLTEEIAPNIWKGKANVSRELQVLIELSEEVESEIQELAKSFISSLVVTSEADIFWYISKDKTPINNDKNVVFSSINSQLKEQELLLSGIAQLYVLGVKINWQNIFKNSDYKKIVLPTYPFQRNTYWID